MLLSSCHQTRTMICLLHLRKLFSCTSKLARKPSQPTGRSEHLQAEHIYFVDLWNPLIHGRRLHACIESVTACISSSAKSSHVPVDVVKHKSNPVSTSSPHLSLLFLHLPPPPSLPLPPLLSLHLFSRFASSSLLSSSSTLVLLSLSFSSTSPWPATFKCTPCLHSLPSGQNPAMKNTHSLLLTCLFSHAGPFTQNPLSYSTHLSRRASSFTCRYRHSSPFWQYPCWL